MKGSRLAIEFDEIEVGQNPELPITNSALCQLSCVTRIIEPLKGYRVIWIRRLGLSDGADRDEYEPPAVADLAFGDQMLVTNPATVVLYMVACDLKQWIMQKLFFNICLLVAVVVFGNVAFAQKLSPPGSDMASIPGGTFWMGTDPAKIAEIAASFGIAKHPDIIAAETPRHLVTLSPFYLDRYEVTNVRFRKFLRRLPQWTSAQIPKKYNNGNYLKDWSGTNFPKGKANFPVINVSWFVAVAYCRFVGKRLPTEAEWEFAARGGLVDRSFPWGDEPVDSSRANYGGSKINKTVAVSSYPANGYGLFDMAGNVWEYMADEWQPYPSGAQTNPVTGVSRFADDSFLKVTTRRVIRGGSWGGSPLNLRVTYRDSHPPDGARDFVGFRCAK